jgi:putative aldouronate transport system substrate-binding protein
MYNAGLIDHDFPLYSDNDVTKRIIASGRVGAFESNWDYIFTIPEVQDGLRAIVPNAEWVALESFPHKLSNDITGLYVFIPKAAKNTEGAMRYLNWLAKFENYNFLQIGNEGINHELVDGLPRIKAPAGDGWFQNSYLNLDYTPLQNGMFLGSQEENIKAIALSYPFPSEMILQAYNAAMYNARPVPVVPTSKPLVAAGPLLATLNQQIDELLVQATVASPENFDKIWDTGIASILDSGARTIIEERKANAILP